MRNTAQPKCQIVRLATYIMIVGWSFTILPSLQTQMKGNNMLVNKPGYLEQVDVQPHFQHDCTECIYLGSAEVNTVKVDFYAHERKQSDIYPEGKVELIYRTSSEDSDYGCSMPSYTSPLSVFPCMALALYIKYLGANGANGFYRGTFFKDDKVIFTIK